MIDSNKDLTDIREHFLEKHRDWKVRLRTQDLIHQRKWATVWPDLTEQVVEPVVEHVYNEALMDKAASAAGITPFVSVAPTRGTKEDRAERNAQLRRRVFMSVMRDSEIADIQTSWAFDWLQAGAMFTSPWKDWDWYGNGGDNHPYLVHHDPRHTYPVAHNSRGELTAGFVLKYRRIADLVSEYGANYPPLQNLKQWGTTSGRQLPETVEEFWWFDDRQWGVALLGTAEVTAPFFRYVNPVTRLSNDPYVQWLVPLEDHGMGGCPLVEKKKQSADSEYRGVLEDAIPQLKVAQQTMLRILEDLEFQTAAPLVADNIDNLDEFGAGQIMVGDGEGPPSLEAVRMPSNFEAHGLVASSIEGARNVVHYPKQRSGDPGASISSGKATFAIQGGFNSQLAWNQRDLATLYRRALVRTADFDEKHCQGRKEILGWDEGEFYTDKYDSKTFWRGDHRVEVGFHRVGLEEQQHLSRVLMLQSIGGMSMRTAMRLSGMIDNPLFEESEIAEEMSMKSFLGFMAQQAAEGNLDPWRKFNEKVDEGEMTARAAAKATIDEMFAVPAGSGAEGGGGRSPDQVLGMQRSLEAGGVPGRAEGQPPGVGPALAGALPAGIRKTAATAGPGASGP